MINAKPIRTENGRYKMVLGDIENGVLYYGVDFIDNEGNREIDYAYIRVFSDDLADGICHAKGVHVESSEDEIFPKLIETLEKYPTIPKKHRKYAQGF